MRKSSESGGRIRRTALGVALAILPMFTCNGADAESTIHRPFLAYPAHPPLATFVGEAAQRFGIPARWICAVRRAESFDDVHATSPRGAMALMPIMPETWADLRQCYRLGANPYDAHDNIMAGTTAYLRELHDSYGILGFLAAYNAGHARWEDHLATGRPLPKETRLSSPPRVNGRRTGGRRHDSPRSLRQVMDPSIAVPGALDRSSE
jgi:soluble lytic murein transglycosylase-like protein